MRVVIREKRRKLKQEKLHKELRSERECFIVRLAGEIRAGLLLWVEKAEAR